MNTPLETKSKPPTNAASAPAHPGLLQRKCACGGSPGIAGDCHGCSSKHLNLQRSVAREADSFAVPSNAQGGVLRAPGQPLEAQARAFTKPRFGHDFSQITLHDSA
ncbi:MAG TPA: hypothetical protein VD835_00270, partial [Pyrinomonadaceae bacterium]|nr:hypothetical protein [Pyrinomonadaceae bacterium]